MGIIGRNKYVVHTTWLFIIYFHRDHEIGYELLLGTEQSLITVAT